MFNQQCNYRKETLHLEAKYACDVLVIGSGIAGISAAIAAAKQNKNVLLVCKGSLFSGSSFYPGTWGLGLIGPVDENDEADLIETITSVGCNMVDSELVTTFVKGINPAIKDISARGVQLKAAQNAAEKEFIPCFDYKQRSWHGLTFDSMKETFERELSRYRVMVLDHYEVVELCKQDDRVHGAVLYGDNALHYISACSVVLATGGYGGLFEHHLCTNDVAGIGQALALNVGARLINMEFMQVMPGYVHPAYQTIFNEKAFRYTCLYAGDKRLKMGDCALNDQELLDIRSSHGPFTSRLASREIDLAIHDYAKKHPEGVRVSYQQAITDNPPEFIVTYFDWLKETCDLTYRDNVFIAPFAHAANGGIRINAQGWTGVEGLYAAGEVTGGMHGADRIGGLSTANGLVFGARAGLSAALHENRQLIATYDMAVESCTHYNDMIARLQGAMSQNVIIDRNETGLASVLRTIDFLEKELRLSASDSTQPYACDIAAAKRIRAQLTTARAIIAAASMRKESRGSHYRSDYPCQSDRFDAPLVLSMKDCMWKSDI